MKNLLMKYALQNAVFYSGKANPGAVMGKVLATDPGLRKKLPEIQKEIQKIVQEVNKLPLDEQKRRLKSLAPELLEREKKVQEGLPELPHAVPGKVVTRFAPSPTGPLNISHVLRAVMLNFLYAKKYGGKFMLRLEDTDASKVRKEFYGMIKQDLRSVEAEPDLVVVQSDRMDRYYHYAELLIRSREMFACFCTAEGFRSLSKEKKPCPHEKATQQENLKVWKDALSGKYKEGEVVFRFRTSMKEPNPAIRNPAMLRISEAEHPLQGKKYRIWPLYNYANVIDDHESGVTHVFRGKEHEHNTSVQKRVYEALGWKPPFAINFGMIYLPGEKIHTRDIREWIKEGKVSGWDDPKLHTVRALVRRGFVPEMFRQLAINTGLSKNDIRIGWENIEGTNRKFIDPLANRYMVVTEPEKLSVKNGPLLKEVEELLHPDFPERGKKNIPVSMDSLYISAEDFKNLHGKEFRLKGLCNVLLKGKEAYFAGDQVVREMQKVQWVSEPHVQVRIVTPEKTLEGIGEPGLGTLKPGTLIQMERIGFGRVDSIDVQKPFEGAKAPSVHVTVFFAHK